MIGKKLGEKKPPIMMRGLSAASAERVHRAEAPVFRLVCSSYN